MERPIPLPPLVRIPGGVCAVKPVENIGQVFGCNSFSVVLNLHLDKIAYVLHPQVDPPLSAAVHVFEGVAHNVIYKPS